MMWISIIGGIGLMIVGIFYTSTQKSEALIKGEQGEKEIRKQLNKLDKTKYTVINDVSFHIKGRISQIDHVVVSDFGIFVIETKNYKGIIRGDEQSRYWRQVTHRYQNNFYNPIKQNQGHIYALNYVLNRLPLINYFSIVVFTNRSKLKVKTMTTVIYSHQLIKKIKSQKTVCISPELKRRIIKEIKFSNINLKHKKSTSI